VGGVSGSWTADGASVHTPTVGAAADSVAVANQGMMPLKHDVGTVQSGR